MRILFLTLNYFPELIGIGKYSGEMAEWFAARGHTIRVVTTPPYYPDWRVHDGFYSWLYRREQRADVKVLRCPIWVPRHPNGFKRILNLASFGISSLPAMLFQALLFRPDIVAVIKPPVFALPAALMAARIAGAKAWVHVQDFEVDVAFDMGMLKGNALGEAVLGFEAYLLRCFDLATTISTKMCDRLIDKYVSKNRIELFPNWVDSRVIYPLAEQNIFRTKLDIASDAIVVLYSGNMGEKQGLDILVEAARLVEEDPRIIMVLAGEGAARHRLESSAVGLRNIKFLPLQPTERFNDLLNLADIHLLPQRADAADLVMPSKLPGMLASGRPVIAGAKLGTQIAMEVEGAGLIVAPDDGVAMADAIRRLANDPGSRVRLGTEARKRAVMRWEREQVLVHMETKLTALVGK